MLNQADLSRIDLNLLVLFDAVLRERHVGRAAQRLNLTPSAVSHGLTRLRRLLDDPVFIKHPRGVVPTARALELAGPVDEILVRVREVLEATGRFDPATSSRRFIIGAPDAVGIVVLPALLHGLQRSAPQVDVGMKVVLPGAFEAALDARAIDLAMMPVDERPAFAVAPRFASRELYEERFVIVARCGHPWLASPTLQAYCAAAHALVSPEADPAGFLDEALATQGLRRRVSLTVPNFLFGMAAIGGTDLLLAVPRRMALAQAARHGLGWAECPVPLKPFRMCVVAPRGAWADSGLAWLADRLLAATAEGRSGNLGPGSG